jgi:hypothetical protein
VVIGIELRFSREVGADDSFSPYRRPELAISVRVTNPRPQQFKTRSTIHLPLDRFFTD